LKFHHIEQVALVLSNMEWIFPFKYFASCECKFTDANEIFHSFESIMCYL
jgi:hypothetical protein